MAVTGSHRKDLASKIPSTPPAPPAQSTKLAEKSSSVQDKGTQYENAADTTEQQAKELLAKAANQRQSATWQKQYGVCLSKESETPFASQADSLTRQSDETIRDNSCIQQTCGTDDVNSDCVKELKGGTSVETPIQPPIEIVAQPNMEIAPECPVPSRGGEKFSFLKGVFHTSQPISN